VGTDKPIRCVVAVGLGDGRSLTLAENEQGWRVVSWSRRSGFGAASEPPPPEADRYFPSQDAAVEFFRTIWLKR
jgi:hypothetical protein